MKQTIHRTLVGCLLLLTSGFLTTARAQTSRPAAAAALYVNDAAQAGDVYTTGVGNDQSGDGSSSAPFATVARALAIADANTATIFIDAGTYAERVILNKNISLQGVDTARTVFDGGLAPSDVQTQETGIFITAVGGTPDNPVKISNLKVRAYDYGIQDDNQTNHVNFLIEDVVTTQNRQFGIYWNGQVNYTQNITFRRVRATKTALEPNTRNNGAGRGLFLVNGSKINILIEDGVFEQNRRAGIDINDGSVSGLVIRNCRFGFNLGPAIAVLGAAGLRDGSGNYTTPAALIENNFIRNNASNGLELKSCTGTGLGSGPGSLVVRNNYIVRSLGAPTNLAEDNAGIAFVDRDRSIISVGGGVTSDLTTGGAYIQNNIVRGYLADALRTAFNINGFGIVLEGANNKVFGNVIANCQRGIQVQDRPANSTGSTPFFDIDRNASLVAVGDSIRNNRLDSCTTSVRAVNLSNVVNASLNWLGSSQVATVRGASGLNGRVVTLGGPATSFAQVSSFDPTGRLDYTPFLHTNTDVAATPGFQSDLSYLHGDWFSPNLGVAPCLQEALVNVAENGTVELVAATYNGTAVITKNVTLTNDGATTLQNLGIDAPGKAAAFAAPFSLSGTLTLTSGLLRTSPTGLLTLTAGAAATEGNAASYVEGPLRKLGNSAFVFPLGKAGTWARLAITAPSSPASAFTAEYFASAYGNSTFTPPLKKVSSVEYWNLDRAGSTDAVGVRLYWENGSRSGIDAFTTDLHVARFDGSTWVSEGNGGLDGGLAAGSVASAGPLASFGPFTFGAADVPLPVKLVSFTATERQPGTVSLLWRTALEENNKGFGVERSLDGKNWQQLAFVEGRGTTSAISNYTYHDQAAPAGDLLYYRLRQVDQDGTVAYSPVAAVNRTTEQGPLAKLTLAPNPASDYTTLQFSAPVAGQLHVSITDLTGRVLLHQMLTDSAEARVQLPASLPAGTYLVRVEGPGFSGKALRLLKQ